MIDKAIGGYFELERNHMRERAWMHGALKFVSGRAAIAAFLTTRPNGTVWLPYYACTAIDEAIAASGSRSRRYMLGPDFGPPADLPIAPSDTVIVIDYFGASSASVTRAIQTYGRGRVLVDASQSLFFPREAAEHIVFSPRKFAGVPDGGLLVGCPSASPVGEPDEIASLGRAQHLLLRSAGMREEGRTHFQQAEASLTFGRAEPISSLTLAMLEGISFDTVAVSRRANAATLRSLLAKPHPIEAASDPEIAPLCVPLLSRAPAALRQRLAADRVFLAHYWPGIDLPANDVHARILAEQTVFLPCDQRYDAEDMERLASLFDQVESLL